MDKEPRAVFVCSGSNVRCRGLVTRTEKKCPYCGELLWALFRCTWMDCGSWMRHQHTIKRPVRLPVVAVMDSPITPDTSYVEVITEVHYWDPVKGALLLKSSNGPKNAGFCRPRSWDTPRVFREESEVHRRLGG